MQDPLGHVRGVRSGHRFNHLLLTALMADRSAWTYVEMPQQPLTRARGHAELAVAAPAYGPEVS